MSAANFRLSAQVITRSIGGETIIVPIRGGAGDLESIYGLNEPAGLIWSLLDGKRPLKDVVQAVLDEYEVDPGGAERDVVSFLGSLEELGLVERVVL